MFVRQASTHPKPGEWECVVIASDDIVPRRAAKRQLPAFGLKPRLSPCELPFALGDAMSVRVFEMAQFG